jgi:hypothetical protein
MARNPFDLNPVIAATGGAPTGGDPPAGSGGVPYDLLATRAQSRGRRGATPASGSDPLLEMLLYAMQRKAMFNTTPFNYTTTAVLLRPQEDRGYFFIQNNSLAQTLVVGIGQQPTLTTGVVIPPGGFYEPFQVPQNEIWILGTGADVGIMLTSPPFYAGSAPTRQG